MNKYFLSIISVLIVLQSLSLVDDFFFQKKEIENSYNILTISGLNKEEESKKSEEPDIKNSNIIKVDFVKEVNSANVVKGNKLSRKCSGCHDLTQSYKVKIGPPLWNIVDKPSGTVKNFKYSNSLSSFKRKWSFEQLYLFLENPKVYVSGTKMLYKGLSKSQDRFDLIAFLNTLK